MIIDDDKIVWAVGDCIRIACSCTTSDGGWFPRSRPASEAPACVRLASTAAGSTTGSLRAASESVAAYSS